MVLGCALLTTEVSGAQGVAFAVVDGWSATSQLHRLDLDTGELSLVGAVGHPVVQIAFDGAEALFGVDPVGDQLLAIGRSGGFGTVVGPLGVDIADVVGLSFDAHDRLWMTARDSGGAPSLFEIDPSSGQATWVAGITEEHLGGLASDGEEMYITTRTLAVVDTNSGAVTPVDGSTFGIWWSRAADFDGNGNLRSLMLCEPCMTPFDVLEVTTVDTATGSVAVDGPNAAHNTWGLAILDSGVFFDGFESEDLTAWQGEISAF
jgi:hypothetical protein